VNQLDDGVGDTLALGPVEQSTYHPVPIGPMPTLVVVDTFVQ
jgi:hypothetical protein